MPSPTWNRAFSTRNEPVTPSRRFGQPDAKLIAFAEDADLVVLCEDDLGENLIRADRIRDLNKRTRIVCRAFHEDAAEILTRPPFECIVLSTSRHAADALARAGAFRDMGIDQPERRLKRELAAA